MPEGPSSRLLVVFTGRLSLSTAGTGSSLTCRSQSSKRFQSSTVGAPASYLVTRENAATKAHRYLVEGRVIVTRVSDRVVAARVRGDGAIWDAIYHAGRWSCSCPANDRCSHLRAVRLVTAPEVVVSR